MKQWAVYKNDSDVRAVKFGFNWWAVLFCGFWSLHHRLWLASAIGFISAYTLNKLPEAYDIPANIGALILMATFGKLGNSWVRDGLVRRGFTHVGIFEAAGSDAAIAQAIAAVAAAPAAQGEQT